MKKFLGIITLAVMVLAVVPQVMAQSAETLAEIERLQSDVLAGRITPQEFERRIMELLSGDASQTYQQDQSRNQQQRQQQQQQSRSGEVVRRTYPGATAGFPPAATLRRYGITKAEPNASILASPYRQAPHSLTFSYRTQGEKLTIYIFKNFLSGNIESAQAADHVWTEGDARTLSEYFFEGKTVIEDPTKRNVEPTMRNPGPHPYYYIEYSADYIMNERNVIENMVWESFIVLEMEAKQNTRRWAVDGH